jgi:hypothetical protein
VQHSELGKSRIKGDDIDLKKVLAFFDCYNPFDITDGIDCDEVESVDVHIMNKLDGASFKDVVMKTLEQVKTLADIALRRIN